MIEHTEYDQYEHVEEFVEELETGIEVEFTYQGKNYSVIPLPGETYSISEAYQQDETERIFSSVDKMLDQYQIDGKPLRALVTELQVTAH